MKRNSLSLAIVCVVAIAVCAWWNWKVLFNAPKFNETVHRGIGEALAAESVKAVEGMGKVVLVTVPAGDSEQLAVQVAAFKKKLMETPGVQVAETVELESDQKAKYSPGAGLSGGKFVRLVKKHPKADLIVSFLGLPELDAKELEELGETGPKFLAFARQSKKLTPLFERKRLHAAVVPRFQFPSPVKGDPNTPQEWFDTQFQWLTGPAKL